MHHDGLARYAASAFLSEQWRCAELSESGGLGFCIVTVFRGPCPEADVKNRLLHVDEEGAGVALRLAAEEVAREGLTQA